jgi:thiol-disulfide isomerase/thioredoxin
MKIKSLYLLFFIPAVFGCRNSGMPDAGNWRAVLIPDTSRPSLEIPFNLVITRSDARAVTATILNAGEEIAITEVDILEDSIHFRLPVFEGTIDARLKGTGMEGTYTHRGSGKSWTVPFRAVYGITDRFPALTAPPAGDISGRWEVMAGSGDQSEKQVGEFVQENGHLTGTFLTTTGDYRFLEGKVSGSKVVLSGFDGAHALVFQADLMSDGSLGNGFFCGGPSWKGEWQAVRNDTVTLPDPTSLTYLKPGYDRIDFTFPGLDGKPVSLTDARFQGKPVIVQIIGSWCPNCMDETRFLSGMYNQYKSNGLNIIALCYESANFENSVKAIDRFRKSIGAEYTFLYAGESNKRKASETLPMLNRILSFPTSIFIDRNGKVVNIYTGFSGPGTGSHYTGLTEKMIRTVREMVRE